MGALPVLLTVLLIWEPAPAHVRATVWVRAADKASGTGWVVDTERRWMVTASHVVGDRDSVDVHFLDRLLNRPIANRRHYVVNRAELQRRGLTATGRVIARGDNADLVLLALDRIPAGTPALTLASESARLANVCRSIGHRHDAELMWNQTSGRVRQVGQLPEGYFSVGRRIGAGVPILLIQSPIEAGESGSAVVNDAGRVIGVVSAVVNQTPGVAAAIDVSELRSLLADARKEPAPTPSDSATSDRADVRALSQSTVWVRPQSTNGRSAGVLIDLERKLVLTSATAVGTEPVVDVVAPKWIASRLVGEMDQYSDRLGLRLSGHCVAGMVVARDLVRDLALIELDAVPPDLVAARLASRSPRMGDPVAAMGHPTGIDVLWLYSAGSVRNVGTARLAAGEERPSVAAALLQLPHQGTSSGGPVVNQAGELVGVLAAREAARQDLAYAAAPDEVRVFLDAASAVWIPRSVDEWIQRGRLALRLDRLTAADEAFRAGSRLSPNSTLPLAGSAMVQCRQGRGDAAIRLVEQTLPLRPDATTLTELAGACVDAGKPDRAAELVERALKLDGRCATAFVVRARLRAGDEAIKDIAEAVDIDPSCVDAYRVRANLRDTSTTEGRREAIGDWSRVLELVPTDEHALRSRASLQADIKEWKKAASDWSQLTELNALRAENWIGLARSRFAAGDRTGAADALRSALRVEPGRSREVFALVRELARELEVDDPADHRRAADWRSLAVSRLAEWLPR